MKVVPRNAGKKVVLKNDDATAGAGANGAATLAVRCNTRRTVWSGTVVVAAGVVPVAAVVTCTVRLRRLVTFCPSAGPVVGVFEPLL